MELGFLRFFPSFIFPLSFFKKIPVTFAVKGKFPCSNPALQEAPFCRREGPIYWPSAYVELFIFRIGAVRLSSTETEMLIAVSIYILFAKRIIRVSRIVVQYEIKI